MRLTRLEFEGVGSFADHMQIDFDTLGAVGLFLIEGPTGAGKSTILDAIVFALYGSPAGSESDPGRLDSHVRDGRREPYVELDFVIDAATYRIRRTPRHERDKKRGTGMRVDDGGVSLVRLTPDPGGISAKAREVGDWVIEHIGLTKQQFVSTIVLAQGEFSSFLNAETRDRTPILEKVFGTEFYQDVEQQLAQMRKAALGDRAAAKQRFTEAVDRCLGLLTVDGADDPLAVIDAEMIRLQSRVDQAEAHAGQTGVALTAARDALAAAERSVAAQENKRGLLGRREELEQCVAGVEALRTAVADHDRAQPVMASLHAWRAAEQVAGQAGAHLAHQREALAGLGESDVTDARLQAITALRASLAHAAECEARLPQMRREQARLQDQVRSAESAVAALEVERDQLLAQVTQARLASQRPVDDGERLASLTAERAHLVQQVATAEQLADDSRGYIAARQEVAEAQSVLDDVQTRLAGARSARLIDLAGTLASQLVDGEACLVCGSVDHPAPAGSGGGSHDGVADLEVLAEQRLGDLQRASAALHGLEGRVNLLKAELTVDPAAAAARLTAIDAEVADLRAAVDAADAAAAILGVSESRLGVIEESLTQARIDAQHAASQVAALQERLQADEVEVATAVADHATVAARVIDLTAACEALAATLAAERAFASARGTADHAQETLAKTLAAVGVQDAQSAEAAILDAVVAEQYRSQIEAHDADVVSVAAALQDLAQVDLGAVFDVAGLQSEVALRQQLHATAQKDLGSLQHTLQAAQPLRAQADERATAYDRVLEDTLGVIRMADLATATRGETIHRVRLSAFVLMRRFEAVVEAANDRLDAISEGRYQLRVEHNGLDNRGQHGLDLVVEDQRTERSRPTTSLSGGESFYVSLALALGLADVVRSESGGVALGTLFIDEGFGSLDSEVLEEVIDMLEQVRAGEDRVIGLVSHVDLLKQRIDPRISVRRDPQRPGVSTLEVHV